MYKIIELINFERIKDVIDIDILLDKKSMVEKFVISPSIEEHLTHLFEDLQGTNHKATQLVGGYGSGKSHLLAFVISVLTEPELMDYIQSEKVRKAAKALNRNFVVISWELQANDVPLSDYFYDRLEIQLNENYGIKYEAPTDKVVDHKAEIFKILDLIKKDNPTRGLVVVVDEISDFLKQKTKEKIQRDVQFLRILGQAAQNSDFTYIGAMQEHVFTNAKYVDEAESFGRVSERFNVVTIKREDIKRVISRRVLSKSSEQRLKLEELFNEYTKYFPNLRANLDEYIDLFPLHPYVIQVFSELPYFEKRGVIQFTMQEVEKILDEEFPCMITYDLIFDEINSKHTVKNLETVSPVVEAVQTLDSKIDLLDTRHQDSARQVIKALAVLKLYGKSTNNGATLEELANTLLTLPANKFMEARDELEIVLNKLRKVTDGQFINKTKEGYYFLDLSLDVDYDQVILRRTENLPENALDDEILNILKEQLQLQPVEGNGIYKDTCRWLSRRSFREGIFVYATAKGEKKKLTGEYQIIFLSPFAASSPYKSAQNTLVVSGSLSSEAVEELKKVAAARALIADNFNRSIMQKKLVALKKNFTEKLIKAYLDTGKADFANNNKSIRSLISREFTNFDELFSEIKPALLDEYFTSRYPEHPKFAQAISRDNIAGEFSSALKELVNKGSSQELFSNAKSIFNALDLLDEEGNFSTAKSKAASHIRQVAKEKKGINVSINEIIEKFSDVPYGYDPIMTKFVFTVLTYNGEIILKAAGGKTITSSEIAETFSAGLDTFENIRYFTVEEDIDIQPIINLFNALDIKPDYLRSPLKRGNAVQDFRTRFLEIKEQLQQLKQHLEKISIHDSEIIDVDGLQAKHEELSVLPIDDFEKIKTPSNLKNIIYLHSQIKEISKAHQLLHKLTAFYDSYFSDIKKDLEYAIEVQNIMNEYPGIIDAEGIDALLFDAFAILKDAERFLEREELVPLIGKLQQIRKKYKAAYYKAHEKYTGSKVDWKSLDDICKSKEFLNLKTLQSVSLFKNAQFLKLEDEISRLSGLRCTKFKADILDEKTICPHCHFPQGFKGEDIDNRLQQIEDKVKDIYKESEDLILGELDEYKENLQLLRKNERELIEDVINEGQLPETITEEHVAALNNLFKELECIEISPQELAKEIFKESQVLDYEAFSQKLEEVKNNLIAGRDRDRVRIKLSEGE
ncbi:MAG: DUF6079 family protein [Bacillota bacterium]